MPEPLGIQDIIQRRLRAGNQLILVQVRDDIFRIWMIDQAVLVEDARSGYQVVQQPELVL